MERKVVLRNIISSILLQIVTIISGFVVPKIILIKFGSDVNGLVSSVNQFLSYITLLEGGVGGVMRAALYKPLRENDVHKINAVINAAEKFFRKIAIIYVAYVVLLACLYPQLKDTGFSDKYSFMLIIVLGTNLFIQYYFSLTYKVLLTADRKVFIVSLSQIIIIFLNMISVVICAYLFEDILIIKLVSALIFVIQPVIYTLYVKKHYQIDKSVESDTDSIKQRWDGMGVNLAAFIHNNTDIVVLTIFSTYSSVSVYYVYYLVVKAVKSLVISVSSSIEPSFGRTLAGSDESSKHSFFDTYVFIIGFLSTVAFTCTMLLITPFLAVYTKGVDDADYYQMLFGYILVISEMIYCLRDPYINVAYSSGKYKEIACPAFIEAFLNIIISVILVRKYNFIGIAIGTTVAMVYRMIAQVIYVKKNILHRPILKFVKSISVFAVASGASVLICRMLIHVNEESYWRWAFSAVPVTLITLSITILLSFIFYPSELKKMLRFREKRNLT